MLRLSIWRRSIIKYVLYECKVEDYSVRNGSSLCDGSRASVRWEVF